MHNLRSTALPLLIGVLAASCAAPADAPVKQSSTAADSPGPIATATKAPFRVPQESEVKDTFTLASIRRGRALIHSTRDSLPDNVGNSLTCANCHMADGTEKDGMPLVGVYARFPQYRARSGNIDLIENRINDCFERSMNGRPLLNTSQEMRDMVSYLAFLSRGFPVGVDMEGQGTPALATLKGDTVTGRSVFVENCVRCHGANGEGTPAGPPVWGPMSYNIGAGMARVNSAARFIHRLMPRDRPGTLTPQQAFDVATYVNTRQRPDFKEKANDWPRGGAPPDVAYPTKAAKGKTPKP